MCPTKISPSEACERFRLETCATSTDQCVLSEGKKKTTFRFLSPGLEALTACSQHITHCVIGPKSEKVVPTAQRNVSLE